MLILRLSLPIHDLIYLAHMLMNFEQNRMSDFLRFLTKTGFFKAILTKRTRLDAILEDVSVAGTTIESYKKD